MSCLRLLHVVRALDTGGLERVVLDLVNGLPQARFECLLACLSHPGQLCGTARTRRVWVGSPQTDRVFLHFPTVWSLSRLVRQEQVDLLHSHNPVPHRYAALVSLLQRRPLVHTKHGRNYPANPRAVWLNRQLARVTAGIAAVSRDAERVALEVEHVDPAKVVLIPNGVDTDRFVPVPDETARRRRRAGLGIPVDGPVVGSVGRLSVEKNYPLLIDAFAGLLGQRPTAYLLLVGDGPERWRLGAQVEALGIGPRVRFAGNQGNVCDWLQSLDVFVLPSDTEGTSISLLEAAATGLPLIATDVGGNRDVVLPEGGRIVSPRDARALTAALLAVTADPASSVGLGRAARAQVLANYSRGLLLRRYSELYERVTGTARRAR